MPIILYSDSKNLFYIKNEINYILLEQLIKSNYEKLLLIKNMKKKGFSCFFYKFKMAVTGIFLNKKFLKKKKI